MDSSKAKPIVIVVALVVAVVLFLRSAMTPRVEMIQAWYVDLGTAELFPVSGESIPPIDTPSGEKQGVRAVVYGCGGCTSGNLKIAYVEKLTDDAIAAATTPSPVPASPTDPVDPEAPVKLAQRVEAGTLVAAWPAADGKLQWEPRASEAGVRITQAAAKVCGSSAGEVCTP